MSDLIPATFLSELTMTSVEIAELTGKRHDNVTKDLKTLEKQGVITLLRFEEREKYGRGNKGVNRIHALSRQHAHLI